jgi:hypothetical protein
MATVVSTVMLADSDTGAGASTEATRWRVLIPPHALGLIGVVDVRTADFAFYKWREIFLNCCGQRQAALYVRHDGMLTKPHVFEREPGEPAVVTFEFAAGILTIGRGGEEKRPFSTELPDGSHWAPYLSVQPPDEDRGTGAVTVTMETED